MLRHCLAVLVVALGAAVVVSACSGESRAEVEQGRNIYSQQCARCHGDAGQGGIGASLIGVAKRFQEASAQELFVTNGGAGMPKFGEILSDDEIRDVVAFTRHQFG